MPSEINKISDVDYRKRWAVLAAVGMGVFLATIDASIVIVALPTLVESFETDFALVQWVPLAYMLTIATLILTMGRLGDVKGKKKIYTIGMAVFILGSILCGLATTIYWLIFSRVFQGIGAAMMASLGTAIVTEAFPASERGRALGSIGGIVSIGIITGPALGGILIDALSWHWIFFVNVPIGIIGLIMVIRFIPHIKPIQYQTFDILGAVILFISVFTFLITLTLGQKLGFKSTITFILGAVWIGSFIVFLIVEFRVQHPLIELKMFQNFLFNINLFMGFLSFVTTAGVVLLMPFYLEDILGYNPHQVGLLLAAVPLSAGIASPISGILSDRFGTRPITAVGLIVLLGGYISLSTLSEQTSSLGYILRFIPVGLGLGIFQSPNNSAIMGAAPQQRLGIVSGLLSITRTLGQTTGIAILGAFWAARTSFYTGSTFSLGPTYNQTGAQLHALHDTISAIIIIVGLSVFLSIWSILIERLRGSEA